MKDEEEKQGEEEEEKKGKEELKVSPYLNHCMNMSINVERKKNEEKKG